MKLPSLQNIHQQEVQYVPVLELLPQLPAPHFLLHTAKLSASAKATARCSPTAPQDHRWTTIGTKPIALVICKAGKCELQTANGAWVQEADPFLFLQQIVDKTCFAGSWSEHIGWFVAFSYDLKDLVEVLPSHTHDDLQLPDLFAVLCQEYILIDELEKKSYLLKLEGENVEVFTYATAQPIKRQSYGWQALSLKQSFLKAVHATREHIAAGDIYQANISQRFSSPTVPNLLQFYRKLVDANPAPMMAFLEFPGLTLLSTSPERFIKRVDEDVWTRPIKGTRPRGKNAEEDQRLYHELKTSEKDSAELAMIVDLMRNDLGKKAKTSSVCVTVAQEIETYSNVFQQVAQVEAQVSNDVPSLELIKACFPAGSITGCPKRRAMEIIEELEPVKRNFYCGSLGLLALNGDFDLNVAIRTLTATEDKMYFSVGSGIVFDSNPESEYEEILAKGKTFFDVLNTYDLV